MTHQAAQASTEERQAVLQKALPARDRPEPGDYTDCCSAPLHKGVQFAMNALSQAMQRTGPNMTNPSINSINKLLHSERIIYSKGPTA